VGEVAAEDLVGYLQVALIRDLLDVAAEEALFSSAGTFLSSFASHLL
jgi:hypothetical protein